jgi:hypothetical protein
VLTAEEIRATGAWLAAQQEESGALPWWRNGKLDPWDHVHGAMGLVVAGRIDEARKAYRYLAKTQTKRGGWYAWRERGRITDRTQESNHAAYCATGLWHYYIATDDQEFLVEMWPALDRAIAFVVSLQETDGSISWAINRYGKTWRAPLFTGNASTHGSLVCAIRIAEGLGHARPRWHDARARLAEALTERPERYATANVPDRLGRFSMDWYYPVLAGALRGHAGRTRLLDREHVERYVTDGVGCRCVDDQPWYTVAETCEVAIALDACGLTHRAQDLLRWTRAFRKPDGGYWTGKTWPEDKFWPPEDNTWTAAAVILASDALNRKTSTSELFRSLSGDDLAQSGAAVEA